VKKELVTPLMIRRTPGLIKQIGPDAKFANGVKKLKVTFYEQREGEIIMEKRKPISGAENIYFFGNKKGSC